jgi:hypothetical protein
MSDTVATEFESDSLVPGRECGSCTVCCKTLKIDVPELKKLAGVLCDHCSIGVGCRIYRDRPPVCEQFYCAWRGLAHLGDEWRPDRCGVLICLVGRGEGIPPEFRQIGLKFDVVDSPRVLTWDPLIKFIGSEIERRNPVFLGIPTPVGYERRKVFLNDALAQAVASRQRFRMIDALMSAFQMGLREALQEKTIFS